MELPANSNGSAANLDMWSDHARPPAWHRADMNRPVESAPSGDTSRRGGIPPGRESRAVVGFDSTTASVDALAYGIGWARRVSGRLDVLYVRGDGWQWVIDACAVMSPVGMTAECLGDVSGTVADLLRDAGLPWSYATAEGAVATALEHHADRTGADAIIIGRPRRRARTLRTSTAHQLLRCTDRIVIVVP